MAASERLIPSSVNSHMTRKKLLPVLFVSILFAAIASTSKAQVVPSAFRSPISLSAGAEVSAFNPDYVSNHVGGIGAFVDLSVFHGIGVEAEGRWDRIHESYGVSEDNYLIGPRVQLHRVWRARPYVKGLVGASRIGLGDYGPFVGTGRFTTVALGGGFDVRVTHRVFFRADGEYQWWPSFPGESLKPYGVSLGLGYRIF
jgi:hypothetical protein